MHAKKRAGGSVKLEPQEVVMMLGTEPAENSREFPLIHKVYCLACDYMPLISYMYSPPVVVSQSKYLITISLSLSVAIASLNSPNIREME